MIVKPLTLLFLIPCAPILLISRLGFGRVTLIYASIALAVGYFLLLPNFMPFVQDYFNIQKELTRSETVIGYAYWIGAAACALQALLSSTMRKNPPEPASIGRTAEFSFADVEGEHHRNLEFGMYIGAIALAVFLWIDSRDAAMGGVPVFAVFAGFSRVFLEAFVRKRQLATLIPRARKLKPQLAKLASMPSTDRHDLDAIFSRRAPELQSIER